MEVRLEKVNGVRGEKLEVLEVCRFFKSLDIKRKGIRVRVEEFIGFRENDVLEMGSICVCFRLDGDIFFSLFLVFWKVSDFF